MDINNSGSKKWNPAITPLANFSLTHLIVFIQTDHFLSIHPYTKSPSICFLKQRHFFQLGIYSAQVSQHIMPPLNLTPSCMGWVSCAGTEPILSHLIAMLILLLLSSIQTKSHAISLHEGIHDHHGSVHVCQQDYILCFTCTMPLKRKCGSRKQSGEQCTITHNLLWALPMICLCMCVL